MLQEDLQKNPIPGLLPLLGVDEPRATPITRCGVVRKIESTNLSEYKCFMSCFHDSCPGPGVNPSKPSDAVRPRPHRRSNPPSPPWLHRFPRRGAWSVPAAQQSSHRWRVCRRAVWLPLVHAHRSHRVPWRRRPRGRHRRPPWRKHSRNHSRWIIESLTERGKKPNMKSR